MLRRNSRNRTGSAGFKASVLAPGTSLPFAGGDISGAGARACMV